MPEVNTNFVILNRTPYFAIVTYCYILNFTINLMLVCVAHIGSKMYRFGAIFLYLYCHLHHSSKILNIFETKTDLEF